MKLKITDRAFDILTGIILAVTFIVSWAITAELMSYNTKWGLLSLAWFALWLVSILMVSYGNLRTLNKSLVEEENKK